MDHFDWVIISKGGRSTVSGYLNGSCVEVTHENAEENFMKSTLSAWRKIAVCNLLISKLDSTIDSYRNYFAI